MAAHNPKHYFDAGRTVTHDADLTAAQMEDLRRGEIFTLLDVEGRLEKRLLMYSYDQLLEGPLEPSDVGKRVLGLPPSPHVGGI